MRAIIKVFSQFHRYLLWALISVFLWAWVFMLRFDTTQDKKVVIYSNTPEVLNYALAAELEKDMPEGIKTVKVRPFSYDIFSEGLPADADIVIINSEDARAYIELLSPIVPESSENIENGLIIDGSIYGLVLFDAGTGTGSALDYFTYGDESFYICFTKSSVHLTDGAARYTAERILGIK